MTRIAPSILILALVFAGWTGLAPAQQKGDRPLHVVTYVDVYPNFAAEAAKLLDQWAVDSRKEPGSVRFEALRDVDRINHFAIVETWQTRQAFENHLAAAHSRQVREKIQPSLGSPFDERLYYSLP